MVGTVILLVPKTGSICKLSIAPPKEAMEDRPWKNIDDEEKGESFAAFLSLLEKVKSAIAIMMLIVWLLVSTWNQGFRDTKVSWGIQYIRVHVLLPQEATMKKHIYVDWFDSASAANK